MKYISLKLPPGFDQNGTVYDSPGRYVGGDRVRWQNGLLRPIGGWRNLPNTTSTPTQIIPTPADQISRAMLLWTANDGSKQFVAGHNEGLSAYNFGLETVHDITPAGFVNQPIGAIINTGYGGYFYGVDAYGTPRAFDPNAILTIFNWILRPYGEQMVAAPRTVPSSLYLWDGDTSNIAVIVANAPTNFTAMHVTNDRSVMVGGSATEQRLITWSDVEDITDWTPSLTNQAGDYILAGIGRIEEIVSVRGVNLIVTENDAYIARYVGPPYVYSFSQVGDSCGTISGAAVAVTKDFAVWPGTRNFFIFDGTVREIKCDVLDGVASSTSSPLVRKVTSFVNSVWSEIWWLFPSEGAEEPDTYVFWNYQDDHWGVGTFDRSVGGGSASLGGPLMISLDGLLYEHEVEGVIPGDDASDVFAITAPLDFENGNQIAMVSQIIPDFIANGEVDIFFDGQDIPNSSVITYGPYRIKYPAISDSNPTPTRVRGRQISMRVQGATSVWSLGNLRAQVMLGGKK